MMFAAPRILVALGLLVPVLVAFLVRRRRHTVRVPSTLLFRLAARTTAPNRKIRWLRRAASLAACLLAVAALVVAAARPSPRNRGETTAIVVDVSASMGAGASSSPIVAARKFTSRLVGGAGPGDRFLLVAAGAAPVRLAGPIEPGPELDEAIARLAVERGGADREAAIDLAADLLAGSPEPRIVLLHDGGESLGDAGSAHRGIPVRERVFAPPARDNLGVTAFATRAPIDAASDEEREALISVATSSDHTREARIIVSVEGHEIVRRSLQIPANGEAEARVRVRASATRITARVEAEDGVADALAADDEAALTEATHPLPRVLLIGRGTPTGDVAAFFVEKAIQAAGVREIVDLNPNLTRREDASIPPRAFAPEPGDVIIALGVGPDRAASVPALYLGTASGVLPVHGLANLDGERTHLRSMAAGDALLRGVALDGLTIGHATRADVPTGARSLVELDGGAVLLAGGVGQGAWIWVGIEPAASDMVLRVAFPVLIANALGSLGGASNVAVADTVARSEVALRASPIDPVAAEIEPDAPWRLGVSPAAVLAAIAALLLGLEAWTFRKGWAE
jgi:VWA domain-containing protein/aerotolerance regulator-like protein